MLMSIKNIRRAISLYINQSHVSPVNAETISKQNYQFIIVLDLRAGTSVVQGTFLAQ